MHILIFLEERVLVMGLLQLLILVPHIPYRSFHLLLHVLNFFGSFNQLYGSHFDFLKCLRAASSLGGQGFLFVLIVL